MEESVSADLPASISMSIRQIRINSQEQIRQRVKEYVGKKIHFVLMDQTSGVGKLIRVDNDGIVFENGRLKQHRILYGQISEIYFDQII